MTESRPTWPVPDDEQLRAEVRQVSAAYFEERVARLRFIYEEFGPPADKLISGGIPAAYAIEELQHTYIEGHYLSTILTAQVFVEYQLGGMFIFAGEDKIVVSGFKKLIDEAARMGAISTKVAEQLHLLREMRNPYSHPHVGMDPRGHMARFMEMARRTDQRYLSPEQMAEEDARFAIRAVVDFLRERSPNWAPPENGQ